MSNIRRSMMAASRSGSAIDWEIIARGMIDYVTPFELPEGLWFDASKNSGFAFRANATGTLYIPSGNTAIGSSTFQGSGFVNVVVPNTVTTLNTRSFSDMSKLEHITLPNTITKFPNSVFNSCNKLQDIVIPNSVTELDTYVFHSCGTLKTLTIPNGVTKIGDRAFNVCGGLLEVILEPTSPPTLGGSYVFNGCTKLAAIYVPDASVNTYKSAQYWSNHASKIKGISERPT